jgi:hypothetical protein
MTHCKEILAEYWKPLSKGSSFRRGVSKWRTPPSLSSPDNGSIDTLIIVSCWYNLRGSIWLLRLYDLVITNVLLKGSRTTMSMTPKRCNAQDTKLWHCVLRRNQLLINGTKVVDSHLKPSDQRLVSGYTNGMFVPFNYTRVLIMVFRRPQDLSGGECNTPVTWIDLVGSHPWLTHGEFPKFPTFLEFPTPLEIPSAKSASRRRQRRVEPVRRFILRTRTSTQLTLSRETPQSALSRVTSLWLNWVRSHWVRGRDPHTESRRPMAQGSAGVIAGPQQCTVHCKLFTVKHCSTLLVTLLVCCSTSHGQYTSASLTTVSLDTISRILEMDPWVFDSVPSGFVSQKICTLPLALHTYDFRICEHCQKRDFVGTVFAIVLLKKIVSFSILTNIFVIKGGNDRVATSLATFSLGLPP